MEKCDICGTSFLKIDDLAAHLSEIHDQKNPFVCAYCQSLFTTKCSIELHIFNNHANGLLKNQIICSLMCKYHFTNYHTFKKHLQCTHNLQITKVEKRFANAEDFCMWKTDLENTLHVKYVKDKMSSRCGVTDIYYKCIGTTSSQSAKRGKMKTSDIVKINYACPSVIFVRLCEAVVIVNHFTTHLHEIFMM